MPTLSPQKGTKFSIYLPATVEAAHAPDDQKELQYPTGDNELILIVDDEENIREITRATLEKYNYQTITANDGAEAIAAYVQNSEKIRLILTDLAMPYMDGAAMIRAVRKMNPQLPIIAASGLIAPAQTAELQSLNVADFLPKPYTAEKLLTTIGELLGKK
jgi:two-component system cell cycle sensor histidine kinase/response regulator CckA